MNSRILIFCALISGIVAAYSVAHGQPAQLPENPAGPNTSENFLDRKYLLGDFNKERSHLEDEGLLFTPIYSAEVFGNPIGGVKQGVFYEGLLDLELTLDFKKMADWDGSFHVSSYYPMGQGLSQGYTKDIFTVSNIDAYDTPHLFELWYEQKFLQDKAALRVGQLGVDTEFAISTTSANFLNSTYGFPAIIAAAAPVPAYPYGAPAVRLRLDPDPHWTFLGAIFAGNPAPDRIGDPNPNRTPDGEYDNTGTDFNINGHQGLFNIDELQYNWNKEKDAKGLPATYKVGGWFHTDTFSSKRYDNTGLPLASPASSGRAMAVDGNNGFYVVADQAVWQNKSNPGQTDEIDVFFRAGNALGDRSTFNYYCDGGITFNGVIPGRPNDLFGLATAYGNIGSGLRGYVEDENSFNGTSVPVPDFEENVELTYYYQITPWWSVQPDLQVIFHPGGSSAVQNAVVLGARAVITF